MTLEAKDQKRREAIILVWERDTGEEGYLTPLLYSMVNEHMGNRRNDAPATPASPQSQRRKTHDPFCPLIALSSSNRTKNKPGITAVYPSHFP